MRLTMLLLPILVFAIHAGQSLAMEINVQTGVNYNIWDSDADERGSQTYVPVTINAQYRDVDMKVLTAFAYTDGGPAQGSDTSLSSVIDTKVNVTYGLVEKFPVDILFGVDFNLPTGKTELDFSELQLLRNPDLLTITRYGEGFNVNPILTVARQAERWAVGLGVGYVWRGEYDFSESLTEYDPGDIFNLTVEAVYAFSDRWQGRVFGELASYDTDELDDQEYYQEGDYLMGGVGATYRTSGWDLSLTAKGIFRGKSDFQEADLALVTEELNSYGDEYQIDLSWLYRLNAKTSIRGSLAYLYLMENNYDESSPLYFGEKHRVSLGIGAQHQFASQWNARAGLNGYLLDEDRNWYHDDDRTYQGLIIDLAVSKAF